jgi:8-oxo-dGTP pyrophosphatase MutT (NUDIX family)
MKTYATVIGVVQYKKQILILKRTPTRHSSPSLWQPVSGYLGERESAEEAVLREVKEETGLDGEITKSGKVFEVTDKYGRWIILTYLVKVTNDKVKIDPKEHSDYEWIRPQDYKNFKCVKGVKEDLKSVGLIV